MAQEAQRRVEAKLDSVGVEGNGGSSAAAAASPGTFVATRTGSMFHRPDCPVVADRADKELRTIKLPASGMSPCKLCAPLD